jgi:tetratricopeptide (TPR) repeat protein
MINLGTFQLNSIKKDTMSSFTSSRKKKNDLLQKFGTFKISDSKLFQEIDKSELQEIFHRFRIYINNEYDASEIENGFVFENEIAEKGIIDTFNIGDDIPSSLLQALGCGSVIFCQLFKSTTGDTSYYYTELIPNIIYQPYDFNVMSGTYSSEQELFSTILSQIEDFTTKVFELGRIVHINNDICYIENKYKVGPELIGRYLTYADRFYDVAGNKDQYFSDMKSIMDHSISELVGPDKASKINLDDLKSALETALQSKLTQVKPESSVVQIPCELEVKTVTDSLVTAKILQPDNRIQTPVSINLKKGDRISIKIRNFARIPAQELYKYWPSYGRNIVKLLISQKRYQDALKIYGDKHRLSLEISKNSRGLRNYALDWALAGKNLKSALKAAKKSLELKETDYAWDTLSLVYWKMGKYQEALEAEEKALQLAGGKDKDYEKRIADIKADMEKKGKKVKG